MTANREKLNELRKWVSELSNDAQRIAGLASNLATQLDNLASDVFDALDDAVTRDNNQSQEH